MELSANDVPEIQQSRPSELAVYFAYTKGSVKTNSEWLRNIVRAIAERELEC